MMNLTSDQAASLDEYLATPAIITKEMCEAEIRYEFEKMIARTLITRDFVDGKCDPDFFENAMHELGVDIYHAQAQWDEGVRFI